MRAATLASTSTSSPSSATTIRLRAARPTHRSHLISGLTADVAARESAIGSPASVNTTSIALMRDTSDGRKTENAVHPLTLPMARHLFTAASVFLFAALVEKLRIDALRGGNVVEKPVEMEFHGASRARGIMRLDRAEDGLMLHDHARDPSLLRQGQSAR